MPEFIITTCPHCNKIIKEEVLFICGGVKDNNDYKKGPDRVYTKKIEQEKIEKPHTKECPFCNKLINMDDPSEYKHKLIFRPDPIKKRIKDLLKMLLP